ncbi:MAG: ATP synthase F1 subunit delta [Candidatus Marinimicrobia bacterium]|nr:ATP synthase F1 subunit delta [Candidatus Neomarinimicrobiota bacterium]
MTAGPQARKFARAALKVAVTMRAVEGFLARFEYLAQAFRTNRAFRHLLITHRVPLDNKMEVLRQAFRDDLTELEFVVLRMLMEQQLGIQLPGVAKSLAFLAQAEYAQLILTVFTPQPLSQKELQALGGRVEQSLGRSLQVKGVTDPSLIGGIKLRLGNILVDGSIARRLELLREELV